MAFVTKRIAWNDNRIRSPLNVPSGLCLSGGGFKGSFEVGALIRIHQEHPHILENVVSMGGSSIGGINTLGIALGLYQGLNFRQSLEQVKSFWLEGSQDDLLRSRWSGFAKTGVKLFLKNWLNFDISDDSLFKTNHIEKSLLKLFNLDPRLTLGELARWTGIQLFITGTNLSSGFVETFDPSVTVIDAMMGTSALPAAFPIRKINGDRFVDGGVYQNTPLRYVIKSNVRQVLTVFLDPKPQDEIFLGKDARLESTVDALEWVLNGWHSWITQREVEESLEINQHIESFLSARRDIKLYQELLKSSRLNQSLRSKIKEQLDDNKSIAKELNEEYKLRKKGHRTKRIIDNFINVYPVEVMKTLDASPEAVSKNLNFGLEGKYIVEERN